MADFRNIQAQQRPVGGARADAGIDQGLRSYMLGVYNMMAIGGRYRPCRICRCSTRNDHGPSAAVAQLANGKMLTGLGVALYTSRSAGL